MSVNYRTVNVNQDVVESYTCNCCGKTTDVVEDPIEAQEYMIMDWCGGYSSVFGDSVEYEVVLCQVCIRRLIGHYFKNKETGEYFEQ